jgi:hypothetical protein
VRKIPIRGHFAFHTIDDTNILSQQQLTATKRFNHQHANEQQATHERVIIKSIAVARSLKKIYSFAYRREIRLHTQDTGHGYRTHTRIDHRRVGKKNSNLQMTRGDKQLVANKLANLGYLVECTLQFSSSISAMSVVIGTTATSDVTAYLLLISTFEFVEFTVFSRLRSWKLVKDG